MLHFSIDFPFIFTFVPIILVLWYVFFREKNGIAPLNSLLAKFLKNPKSLFALWFLRAFVVVLLLGIGSGAYVNFVRFAPSSPKKEVIIVLDISRSMLTEEGGISRIQSAKQVISGFISEHSSYSFGLIVFAGKPFLLVASSQDTSGIREYISHISVDTIRQSLPGLSGTNIADALLLASQSFDTKSVNKQIILITDGDKNLGSDPISVSQRIANTGISLHAVALLSSDPTVPLSYTNTHGKQEFLQDENGEKIFGNTDSELLRKIAIEGNGQFFESKNLGELEKVFETLSGTKQEKKHLEKKYVHFPLAPIFCIAFLLFLVGERWYTKRLFGSVYRKNNG